MGNPVRDQLFHDSTAFLYRRHSRVVLFSIEVLYLWCASEWSDYNGSKLAEMLIECRMEIPLPDARTFKHFLTSS